MEYLAWFEPAVDGGLAIRFPDFPRGVAKGDNDLHGMDMARDLLRKLIEEHARKGEELPQPGLWRGRDYRVVRLPSSLGSDCPVPPAVSSCSLSVV